MSENIFDDLYKYACAMSSAERQEALRVVELDRADQEQRRQAGEDVEKEATGLLLWRCTLEAAEAAKDGPKPPPTKCRLNSCNAAPSIPSGGPGTHPDMCAIHAVLWVHLLAGRIDIPEFDRLAKLPVEQWPKRFGGAA